jgi:hypothetical protein
MTPYSLVGGYRTFRKNIHFSSAQKAQAGSLLRRAAEDRSIVSLWKPLSGALGESRKFSEQTKWLTSVPTVITFISFNVKYEINVNKEAFHRCN